MLIKICFVSKGHYTLKFRAWLEQVKLRIGDLVQLEHRRHKEDRNAQYTKLDAFLVKNSFPAKNLMFMSRDKGEKLSIHLDKVLKKKLRGKATPIGLQ